MHHHGSRIEKKTQFQHWYMMIIVCDVFLLHRSAKASRAEHHYHNKGCFARSFYSFISFPCALKMYAIPKAVQTVWVRVVIRVETYKSTHKAAYPNEQHCYLFVRWWHLAMHFAENHVIKWHKRISLMILNSTTNAQCKFQSRNSHMHQRDLLAVIS